MGFGFWVLGFGFWVLGFGFWVWLHTHATALVKTVIDEANLEPVSGRFGVLGLGFRVWGLGFGV